VNAAVGVFSACVFLSLIFVSSANITAIATGAATSCAVLSSFVYCWGDSTVGEIGLGTSIGQTSVPTSPALYGVFDVSLEAYHTCVIMNTNRALQCWGYNSNGMLGDNSNIGKFEPQNNLVLMSVSQVVTGTTTTCALHGAGVYCWGRNTYGTLGDGTTTEKRYVPSTPVLTGVSHIFAGDNHHCSIQSGTGDVLCWGLNNKGQIGDGSTTTRLVPTRSTGVESGRYGCGGTAFTCVIVAGGVLLCYGDNSYGQLGVGNLVDSAVALNVTESSGYVFESISCGRNFVCGMTSVDGDVRCWGENTYGQLGDGTLVDRHSPPSPVVTTNVKLLSCGGDHVCVLSTDSVSMACWGRNFNGQLGVGNTIDVLVPPSSAIVFPSPPAVTPSPEPASGGSGMLTTAGTIALAVVLPVAGLMVVGVLVGVRCVKTRQMKSVVVSPQDIRVIRGSEPSRASGNPTQHHVTVSTNTTADTTTVLVTSVV
jgi:alpha-tubulin suppressor-like RCC1 family protein